MSRDDDSLRDIEELERESSSGSRRWLLWSVIVLAVVGVGAWAVTGPLASPNDRPTPGVSTGGTHRVAVASTHSSPYVANVTVFRSGTVVYSHTLTVDDGIFYRNLTTLEEGHEYRLLVTTNLTGLADRVVENRTIDTAAGGHTIITVGHTNFVTEVSFSEQTVSPDFGLGPMHVFSGSPVPTAPNVTATAIDFRERVNPFEIIVYRYGTRIHGLTVRPSETGLLPALFSLNRTGVYQIAIESPGTFGWANGTLVLDDRTLDRFETDVSRTGFEPSAGNRLALYVLIDRSGSAQFTVTTWDAVERFRNELTS